MIQVEFVFEEAPFPSCHAATIAELPNGEMLAAWFGGQREGANDVGIWSARRAGGKWTAPANVAMAAGVPCWNPVLHRTRGGTLLLFYKAGPSPREWSGMLLRSHDEGRTWSRPEQLPAGILGPVKNKPLELEDGTLVCGSSVESYGVWGCWVEQTRDEGRTWSKHGPINLRGNLNGMIQPTPFRGRGDELVMLCRTRGVHQMARATSPDRGQTWSDASLIELPQNNSGLDSVRLKDGRVVVIYNHTTEARTPLNLSVSGDLGLTWTRGPVLEDTPGEYSYPCIIQGADGTVHAAYTWKRQRIRYASLRPDDLPRP